MADTTAHARETIPEEVMLRRLAQSEQMRDFFIQMWQQNPLLAKQGGQKVQSLLTPLEGVGMNEDVPESSGTGMAKQRGISLVELIMFIVIISVSLTGILTVMNVTTRHSADPLIHKQALAIAESLLEEVELMHFTYCDPDDPLVTTAASDAVCATPEGIGAETIGGLAETRGGAGVNGAFDNVSDYNDFVPGAVVDINGNGTPALAGYTAAIAVTNTALGVVPATESLLITVTVDNPGCEVHPCIRLDGYRTRYSPRSVP